MSKTNIMTAPKIELENLEEVYIELTNQNCNLKCKHCYIDFVPYKKIKDFIPVDIIKTSLEDMRKLGVKMVYLTGGEPLLHPDFNLILRTCLKYFSTTVWTNGVNINDKKARFLRKVEDEGSKELLFNISLDSADERKNDDLRGRGSFRKAVNAVQSLIKYGFMPRIILTNYYAEEQEDLMRGFEVLLKRYNIDIDDVIFEITPYFDKNKMLEITDRKAEAVNLPCKNSRILTGKGVYNCPFLAGDHRARSGSDFKTFSSKAYLETQICSQCISR